MPSADPPAPAPAPSLASSRLKRKTPPSNTTSTLARQTTASTSTTKTSATTHVLRPHWSYLHLTPICPPSTTAPPPLDAPTLRLHLLTALTNHLGLHGSAIPIDILSIDPIYIRVPIEDGPAINAAIASYVGPDAAAVQGLRVVGRGNWLAELIAVEDVRDFFDFGRDVEGGV